MPQKNPSQLSDQELLREAKRIRSAAITNALFIGFLVGIIVYSIFQNRVGLFTLIPLFLAYQLIKKPAYSSKEIDDLLKKRKLK